MFSVRVMLVCKAPCAGNGRRPWPARQRALGALAGGVILLMLSAAARGECACLWQGSFADVQGDTDLVVAGEVQAIKGNALDLRVVDELRGLAYRDTIRIWLHTRDYCRPPIDDFPVGSRWVMALHKIRRVPADGFDPGTPNQSYGRPDDYILSNCGAYWLKYSGEAVTGNLIDAPRWAREVDMTPVLLTLLKAYLRGDADRQALQRASAKDPALDTLRLDTRAFLRGDDALDEP